MCEVARDQYLSFFCFIACTAKPLKWENKRDLIDHLTRESSLE